MTHQLYQKEFRRRLFGLICLILSFVMLIIQNNSPAQASSATSIVNKAAARTESGIKECGKTYAGRTARINLCISRKLSRMCGSLKRPDVIAKAPLASPTVTRAASKLRRKATRRGATLVLNKARSTLRALAAKSSGDTRKIYSRVARVFTVAIDVINSKG